MEKLAETMIRSNLASVERLQIKSFEPFDS